MRRLGPIMLLVAYGGTFALAAFGRGVPAFDDHPGQFLRLWHLLERSLPGGAWTADWDPDWWGGYPELAFYPPGFALLGATIRLLAFWQPSVELVYRLLCAFVLLLPAATTYALMLRTVEDRWLALPPAFLALTLSAGLRAGVEESVRWGMLTTRLSLGCLPLLVLALRSWLTAGRAPVWAPMAGVAVLLAHPVSTPAVTVALGVATLLAYALRPRRRTLGQALAVIGLSIALSAFWTVPFLVRRAWVVPLAWGDLTLPGFIGEVGRRPVLLAVLLTAPLAWAAVARRRRPFDALLAALPVALTAVFLADLALFSRGWSTIEPARLADWLVFTALWAAGLGAGVLATRFTPRGDKTPRRMRSRMIVALGIVAVAALFSSSGSGGPTGEPTLTLWPRATQWPTLDRLSEDHDLPRLWAALRGTPDRVLFLTSSLRLDGNPAWYAPHSHVPSLTPLLAGREIVHGTFTHPSPLAARFYAGTATPPGRIDTLVERLDGRRLLGQAWEHLRPDAFEEFARRLRVATVVVPTAEASRAGFLAPSYGPTREVAGFTVFERQDRPWPRVERLTHRRYRVLVSPTGGVWIPTGIAAYPLWEAKSARGALQTRADSWGLLELRVPIDIFEAELVYSEGWLDWSSLGVTVVGILAWAVWAWQERRSAAPPRPGSGTPARERRRRRSGAPLRARGSGWSRSGPGRPHR